ncbi:MAG: glycosyltransferase [Pseudomonadota bacterium]
MTTISVLIPTFRRAESFLRAARSVLAQRVDANIELIAVDNSPEGSAIHAFRAIARRSPSFGWDHEPAPGVANARNAALALARGDFIAWLDDDEEAPPTWLAAMLDVITVTNADCVFGPVHARAPENTPRGAYYEQLYTRLGPNTSGAITQSYGIGNSMQRRDFFAGAAPFDPRANETGGEDDRLFAEARARGARFAWAAEAVVLEHIDPARANLRHALKRAFAFGQGPCETAWRERDMPTLARHMSIGLGQALVFGAGAIVAFAALRPNAARLLDRAARGAGKVLWFWQRRFYGARLAARQPA